MTDHGSVTVLIPHWNRAELLREALKRLAQQTYPIHRTVIIDNGSTDNSAVVAQDAGADVIPLRRNFGFAYAVNRGIESSATEWVAIVNNDVALEPAWLEEILDAATRTKASFATGKLLSLRVPGFIDGTYDLVCRGGTACRAGYGRRDGPDWLAERRIQFAPLTAAVFRRTMFQQTGLLDERFESYLEDVDLGFRCCLAGISGVYVPSAKGTHTGSATRGPWHKDTVRQLARNQVFIVYKHLQSAPRWPILVSQLLWGLIAIRHGAGLPFFLGKLEAWRGRRTWSQAADSWQEVREAIQDSEDELLALERRSGFDAYWRWYFMLTRGVR